jgi:glycine/serine hydroxymethyltransferase
VHQLTRLGMRHTEMKKVAQLIAAGLREPSRSDVIRKEVGLFRADFQHIGYSLD